MLYEASMFGMLYGVVCGPPVLVSYVYGEVVVLLLRSEGCPGLAAGISKVFAANFKESRRAS
jgi:hypothetical protein